VDASFQSAPNERNSPHYDYDHRIWDRVFSCGDPNALAVDRFQIHHRTLQFETPDHECSLASEEKV